MHVTLQGCGLNRIQMGFNTLLLSYVRYTSRATWQWHTRWSSVLAPSMLV